MRKSTISREQHPSLQAFLRELAAFNSGLCVITARLPIADVAAHEHTSVPRRDLEQRTSSPAMPVKAASSVGRQRR